MVSPNFCASNANKANQPKPKNEEVKVKDVPPSADEILNNSDIIEIQPVQ